MKENIADIVKKVQQGDSEAMDQFIRMTQDSLYKYCLYLTADIHLSRDLCHDTYIRAFGAIGKLNNTAAVKGWLAKIARNIFLDMMKSSSRKNVHIPVFSKDNFVEIASDERNIDEFIDVFTVLARMEPGDREVITLVDIEEYSYKEAAQILDIKEDNLKTKLHRARRKFEEIYKKK